MDELFGYGIGTILGIVFSGAGMFMLRKAKQEQVRCSVDAVGTVVDYGSRQKKDIGNDRRTVHTYYYPILEYPVRNEMIRGQSLDGSTRKKFEIGTELSLRYNPDKPSDMILPARKTLIPFAWLFIGCGIFLFILTIFLVPVILSLK